MAVHSSSQARLVSSASTPVFVKNKLLGQIHNIVMIVLPTGIFLGTVTCLLTVWRKNFHNMAVIVTLAEIFAYHVWNLVINNWGRGIQTLIKRLWSDADLHYLFLTYYVRKAGLAPKLLLISYGCEHGILVARIFKNSVSDSFVRCAKQVQTVSEILLCPSLMFQALIHWDRLTLLAAVIDIVVFLLFEANFDKTHMEFWDYVEKKLNLLSKKYSNMFVSFVHAGFNWLDRLGKCLYCNPSRYP